MIFSTTCPQRSSTAKVTPRPRIYNQCALKLPKSSSFKPRYMFNFISLFSPSSLKNIRLLTASNYRGNFETPGSSLFLPKSKVNFTKIFVKQSYLLLVWVSYLSKYFGTSFASTGSSQPKNSSSNSKPGISLLPKKKTKLTFLKTPMAHKTFSQEQVSFEFFKISIVFTPDSSNSRNDLRITQSGLKPIKGPDFILPMSANSSLFLYLFLRESVPFVTTNLFFLHRFTYSFSFSDRTLFSYYCHTYNKEGDVV